jgi:phage terminase small subunit
LCATEAARVAGYSENGINVTGPKTLKDPKVRRAVDILLEERTTALSPPKVDAAWLLAEAVDSYLIAKGKNHFSAAHGFLKIVARHPAVRGEIAAMQHGLEGGARESFADRLNRAIERSQEGRSLRSRSATEVIEGEVLESTHANIQSPLLAEAHHRGASYQVR